MLVQVLALSAYFMYSLVGLLSGTNGFGCFSRIAEDKVVFAGWFAVTSPEALQAALDQIDIALADVSAQIVVSNGDVDAIDALIVSLNQAIVDINATLDGLDDTDEDYNTRI